MAAPRRRPHVRLSGVELRHVVRRPDEDGLAPPRRRSPALSQAHPLAARDRVVPLHLRQRCRQSGRHTGSRLSGSIEDVFRAPAN